MKGSEQKQTIFLNCGKPQSLLLQRKSKTNIILSGKKKQVDLFAFSAEKKFVSDFF